MQPRQCYSDITAWLPELPTSKSVRSQRVLGSSSVSVLDILPHINYQRVKKYINCRAPVRYARSRQDIGAAGAAEQRSGVFPGSASVE